MIVYSSLKRIIINVSLLKSKLAKNKTRWAKYLQAQLFYMLPQTPISHKHILQWARKVCASRKVNADKLSKVISILKIELER